MATWPLPLVVAIEGNIGVGKSTQVKLLQDLFKDDERVVVLPEPVDEWVDKGFLKAMYENANDPWLLSSFQHMVLMSLAGDLLKALARTPTPAIIITERSPFGNFSIFGKANLTGPPLEMYQHTWERILGGLPAELDVRYIYLQTDIDTIVSRMTARGRDAESNVPRAYLQKLDNNHENFIWEETTYHHVVDGNRDEDAVWQDIKTGLVRWFEEATAKFQTERNAKVTHARDTTLVSMIHTTKAAVAALTGHAKEERSAIAIK